MHQLSLTRFLLVLLLLSLAACREAALPTATPLPPETTVPLQATDTPEPPDEVSTTLPSYQNPTLPTAKRVEDLLERMSLAEKIGQMTLVEKNAIQDGDIIAYAIGGLLSGGGGTPRVNDPEHWLEMVNGFQEEALQTPLAIPLIYGVDAVHGHNNVKGAVIFPHNVGLGATRNPELIAEIGRVTALETAATGIYWNYAPVVAVPQDIRWGRTYEAYGENTELVGELAVAFMRGLQGDDLSAPTTVLATPKHFVGDGGTVWGTSTTGDYMIDQGVTEVDEATLRAVHLPPYQETIAAGAKSIMVSYSSWGGAKMHGQTYLIGDVLKGELGFEGFVVSDWGAIDQIQPGNYYESIVQAINAGIDMNMVPSNYQGFIRNLTDAVENGDVSQERIDDAVRRILTVKFDLGLFEQPLADESLLDLVGSEEHRALAREAVRQSLVLLQNEENTLPLAKESELIFVAGEAADNIGIQAGGWTISWQGQPGNITEGTTILDGIEAIAAGRVQYNRFGRYERVTDENGDPAIADVGIVVVGETPYAEGVGDRADLTLSQIDRDLITRVAERSERVVVVLISGRPLIITDALADSDAFVAAWLPGSESAAVADVLFGDYEFGGQLPHTWPRSMEQVPANSETMPASGCDAPLFPYGYGLTTADPGSVEVPTCP